MEKGDSATGQDRGTPLLSDLMQRRIQRILVVDDTWRPQEWGRNQGWQPGPESPKTDQKPSPHLKTLCRALSFPRSSITETFRDTENWKEWYGGDLHTHHLDPTSNTWIYFLSRNRSFYPFSNQPSTHLLLPSFIFLRGGFSYRFCHIAMGRKWS